MNRQATFLSIVFVVLLTVFTVSANAANPILVITKTANPFSTYLPEILKGEGLNAFDVADISQVSAASLASYDVAVMGEMTLTSSQVSMLTTWVNGGGNLIAMRPDPQLASLIGVAGPTATLADKYLAIDTTSRPGSGIVSDTIQYHGTADVYALSGATAVATLYSSATTPTTNPAVTLRTAGTGKIAAFTYDLARSVVYTRQGNPAWSGQERDGVSPIRSDDFFFGAKAGNVQPDWVDLNKVAIPQADEQQRLLVNLIMYMNGSKKPLPRFWYFPKGVQAAVVMTGDDHAGGSTGPRFDQFIAASPSGCSVADWECIRGTSYVYPNTSITNPTSYVNQGFEIGLHLNTGCGDFTSFTDLDSYFQSQLPQFASAYPGLPAPKTNRTHCIAFSDYDTEPQVELSHGIRFDTNYYYWPDTWVKDRPGMFTGSGMPQRFATISGNLIDVYQATSQMTDESGQSFPATINALLNNAYNGKGFYGAFTANMHTDSQTTGSALWAGQIVSAAQALGVPVVSSLQMMQWLDGRNNSTFNIASWSGNVLSFSVSAATGSRNLRAMLPASFGSAGLTSIQQGATNVSYTLKTIKGIQYAMFPATTGSYTATYGGPALFSISGSVSPLPPSGSVTTVSAVGPVTTTATADGFGNFALGGLPAGTYTITPSNPNTGFSPASRLITISSDNVSGITFTTLQTCPCSLWSSGTSPSNPSAADPSAVELGVRFRPDADGRITGIRFYKGSTNTGTHTGTLWSNTGTVLATATFSNETATGWQQVNFTTPVNVTANTMYVASYHTNAGNYAADENYFTVPLDNSPLHAPADSGSTPNGVYRYGSTSGFPSNTFHSTNYWVDVVYMPAAPTFGISGTLGAGGAGATVSLSGASTATTAADGSGNYAFTSLLAGSYTVTPSKVGVSFSPTSQNVTINSSSVTANFTSTVLTYTVSGTVSGTVVSGVTVSLSGGSSATTTTDASGNFSFSNVVSGTYTVTPSLTGYSFTPVNRTISVAGANVTGVNFTSTIQALNISGVISGTGGNGTIVTLSGSSAATTTADASGNYTFTGLQNGTFTVTPSKSGFTFTPASQNVTINGSSVSAVNFTSTVQTFAVSGTVSGATLSGVTISVTGSATTSATTDASGNYTLNLANGSYTLTPSKNGFTFNPISMAVTVNGATSAGNNFVATASATGPTYTIWSAAAVPSVPAANDPNAVELGVRFRSDVNGVISGIRFYKGSTNTGTHTGSLWTNTGTLLATATFQNETATGWQQVLFTTPVSITANTTYVASYHTNAGNYAVDQNYFVTGVDTPPLHALSDSVAGGNGTYIYGAGGAFPGSTYQMSNYWVDVILNVPPTTYSISGTISGPGGNGATVTLGGASSGSTTADASGNYTFAGLTGGSYTVAVSKSGFVYSPATANVTINAANVTGVNFTSVAQSFSISGTINGAGGNGATVTLGGASTATATADASGNYTFTSLINGAYTVTPSKTGFVFTPASQNVTVNGADATGTNFNSAPTFSISGTVGGSGGPGTTLTLSGTSSGTTTADASGNYTFNGLVDGSYTVTPSKTGLTFTPASQNVTISGANSTAVNFTAVGNTYTVSGTISGPGGSGATVTLTGVSGATTTADASGNYSFAGLVNGGYTVTPSKVGFVFTPASQAVTVNIADQTTVNFTSAAQTYTLSGTISGAGGSGATVNLTGAATSSTTADAAGNYSFTGLVNGTYTVTPTKSGFVYTPASQTVTVANANQTANFTSAVRTFTITGTITGTGGNAATVSLTGAATATVTANASGVYTFTGIVNGAYTVTPSKVGYTFTPASQAVTVNGANQTANFSAAPTGLGVDVTAFTDRSSSATTIAATAVTTHATNELLLAFVAADGASTNTTTVTGISGGGLTWTLVRRTNTRRGTAEIWRAFAAGVVSNATVTATLSRSTSASITVTSFTGVDISGTNGSGAIGAVGGSNSLAGAPSASIVTTRANSFVFAVGNDISAATARTVGANQTMVHQFLSTSPATYWVQRQNATAQLSGTTVTINDTAPLLDPYNLSVVEIRQAP